MKSDKLKESLPAIGVMVSLLFVGYEINQNNRVARAQIRTDLAALNQEMLILNITAPEFYELQTKIAEGEALTEEELRRSDLMKTASMRRLENVYLQYLEGLLDESGLDGYGMSSAAPLQRPDWLAWWQNERTTYNPDFVEFIEARNGI